MVTIRGARHRQDRYGRRHAETHRHRKYPTQSRQTVGQITRLTITDTLALAGGKLGGTSQAFGQ